MDTIVRFAPSPTGQVHIGNIRTAIFNWLFARHTKGKFLLRVEDTDLERSTQHAIDVLIECMNWLGLDYDDKDNVMYQSKQAAKHLEAAAFLEKNGFAYRLPSKDGEKTPLAFRFPWNADNMPAVRNAGEARIDLHVDSPLTIDTAGVTFSQLTKKGDGLARQACLAGFRQLKLYNEAGSCIFELEKEIDNVISGKASFTFEKCASMTFLRREIVFNDIIKGELAKPIDSMKDLLIVRSDDTPVFHLANVCDDITQKVTHIIRGDDHVENTYRHIFLFSALNYPVPAYAHLPMIVNASGKPYSKRDGDAFVGDFKEKGYLPEALFNYLALLGWSPGDDREKLSVKELIELFTLERVKSAPAQFDINKLFNVNGLYITDMPLDQFVELAWEVAGTQEWARNADKGFFRKVAELLKSRTKLSIAVKEWGYFFTDDIQYDMKAAKKALAKDDIRVALEALKNAFASGAGEFSQSHVETAIREAEKTAGMQEGKLNQPLRIAVTGCAVGAGIYETILLLGREKSLKRLVSSLELKFTE